MIFLSYLAKVTICSGLLYLYYLLALRNRYFHQFNRFYLVAAVLFSLVIPAIHFNIFTPAGSSDDSSASVINVVQSANNFLDEAVKSNIQASHINMEAYVQFGYAVISIFMFFSFARALYRLRFIIRKHRVTYTGKVCIINTSMPEAPFSFLKYIFWNDEINIESETGKQIFQHELIHVQQKHTLDNLFIKILLVFFWCNPFFWLIGKELKMLHEFIADRRSIKELGTAAFSKMILHSTFPGHYQQIVNYFFQTPIKRRLMLLAKKSKIKFANFNRILAVGLMFVTVFAFTIKKNNTRIFSLNKNYVVVIDAGHGGKDAGAEYNNVREAAINLAIAKKIKEKNDDAQLKILLTRESDDEVALKERTDFALEHHADLFISIHVNADPKSSNSLPTDGIEVVVGNYNDKKDEESKRLGSALISHLSSVYNTNRSLITPKTGIWVLKASPCPSVLIECGYITNQNDLDFVQQSTNQEIIAEKILDGIKQYLAEDK